MGKYISFNLYGIVSQLATAKIKVIKKEALASLRRENSVPYSTYRNWQCRLSSNTHRMKDKANFAHDGWMYAIAAGWMC